MKNLNLTLTLALLFLSACQARPQSADESFSEKLNGNNYESSNAIMSVPISDRKPVLKKISGKVFCGEGLNQSPANRASVRVMKGSQEVAATSTATDGTFAISTSLSMGETYSLHSSATCGKMTRILTGSESSALENQNLNLKK